MRIDNHQSLKSSTKVASFPYSKKNPNRNAELAKGHVEKKFNSRERKLIFITPASGNYKQLISTIESYDWKIHVAKDIAAAEELYKKHDLPVGLLDIACLENDESLQNWEKIFLSNLDNKWLALLPRDCSPDSRVIEIVKQRFYDFHTLPVDPSRLLMALGHAYGMANLKNQAQVETNILSNRFGILGTSPVMQEFFCNLNKISRVDATVLVGGESGTGKESAAYALHKLSRRADAPFIAVNCGSIPKNLIQSELFGHEKGAFSGAHKSKVGKIESAEGGTIFLDEIGDLPFDLQINLLRFLQEQTIERIGGNASIRVDVRVIAATHVDLETAVAEGRFRADLFYRLNVLHLHVSRLADRGNDIELLANHFFEQLAAEKNPNLKGFSHSALDAMKQYDWPGNVRELMNRVRHAMVMSENRLITVHDMGLSASQIEPTEQLTLKDARASAEQDVIFQAIEYAQHNISEAAIILNISRATLYRLMEKYGLCVDRKVEA